MNRPKMIIRHDDFDFRLPLARYQDIHKLFLDRDLVETANIQFAQFGRLLDPKPEIVKYLLEAPNYDIQLHGWEHLMYTNLSEAIIYRDLSAACWKFMELFGRKPDIWYPPWNSKSMEMEEVADRFGIKIDSESYDLKKFFRETEANGFTGHSIYFHGYQTDEMEILPRALDLIKEQFT